jgi:hypothetical protein
MKKLILSTIVLGTISSLGYGQGIFFSDATTAPAYDTTINGVINTSQDLNLELLYATSGQTPSTPIVTLLLSSIAAPTGGSLGQTIGAAGDISSLGYILDNSSQEYSLPAGNYSLQVDAWTGQFSSYAAALASGVAGVSAGQSAIFSTSVSSSPIAPAADITGVGVIALTQVTAVPEPSTLAMAGVGLASMLIFRRRNK